MITIKEFASLCKCTTQTLRYYDRIDLLKPTKVDTESGYRYYDPSQAINFVKIKSLQSADFTIEEIKHLLTQPDNQVYEAFNRKIAQQEQKLARIREIQQSYLTEKNNMEKIIQSVTDFLLRQITDFEMLREFGLDPRDGEKILAQVRSYLEKWMLPHTISGHEITMAINDEVIRGADNVAARISTLTAENLSDDILLGDETVSEENDFSPDQFDIVWETHGWEHVYEFLEDIPEMTEGSQYCLYFQMKDKPYRDDIAFPFFMLGAMIAKKNCDGILTGCTVCNSTDEKNHFQLLRKKA
ncbi:MAG: MerR family transcriptional regulator [Oscillospiraceae bacterium]|nr:MerR family transcriptional regulator [Oscillospiraceae bacterium]